MHIRLKTYAYMHLADSSHTPSVSSLARRDHATRSRENCLSQTVLHLDSILRYSADTQPRIMAINRHILPDKQDADVDDMHTSTLLKPQSHSPSKLQIDTARHDDK